MTPPAPPGWEAFAREASPYVTGAAFFAGLLFVATYTALARWWKSPLGITIVLLDLMISLALLPGMLALVFGVGVAGSEFWTLLTLAALAGVPVIIMWRLGILVKAQLGHHDSKDEPGA